MEDSLLNLVFWTVAGWIMAKLIASWFEDRIRSHLGRELDEVMNELELEKLIPLTVEVAGNQYLCYNSLTQEFVCQGVDLAEIVKRFKQRYPEKSAAIYNGDETAVRTLKSQLKELDENSSSIRPTS
jgi:hypothetical protein